MDVEPWWLGLTSDHLYKDCPARQRSLPELARVGWDKAGSGGISPADDEVCGWCRRVWLARNGCV
ncbi:MAG: hypothetical protein M3R09_01010 [Actinomycetota bacterium]|nr:hypothetical protein [Actinomycetota bacterium]